MLIIMMIMIIDRKLIYIYIYTYVCVYITYICVCVYITYIHPEVHARGTRGHQIAIPV